MTGPVRYDPSLETIAPGEAATRQSLIATLRSIARTTMRDYGHGVRSVHAKSHALLEGTLTVLDGLPPELAQGMFSQAASYPVVMRLSTNPGDILDDAVSAPRGLAVKVIGVEGERLAGSGGATQDFVMANGPAFVAADAAKFLGSLKLLAASTDRAEGAKKALSAALRGVHAGLQAAGLDSALVKNLGGQPMTHPLGESFYTQGPLRYGKYVAKLMVAPHSPNLISLVGQPVTLDGNPNALRQAAIDALAAQGGEWEVRVQLCTDVDMMPIEDASVVWPEADSPYLPVARIRIAAQPAWSDARAAQADDGLAFSPWHGLAAHQPLGSINRARKPAYAALAELRAQQNGRAIPEPRGRIGLSADPASAVAATFGREGLRNPRPRPERSSPGWLAGAVGGLAGGLLVSVVLTLKEAVTGQANDLVQLDRKLAGRRAAVRAPATTGEDAAGHAGHLALSVASGALYGAVAPRSVPPVVSGLAFGAGFLALAYGIVGPAARLTPPPARDTTADNIQHVLVHALFGVATALVADRIARRTKEHR